MKRTQARENVFYLVFEASFQKDNCDCNDIFQTAQELGVVEYDEYIERVYFGVMAECESIDEKIKAHATGWNFDRLSKVTVAIMRISIYEMLYCEDIPFNVSINEAVELAKKYDYDKAPKFINGVLNKIAETEGLKK